MDSKSLAKSKRAHTQHHSKKSHPVNRPKSSGISENSEKLQGNRSAAPPRTKSPIQSRRMSALPSNWDRYDDNELDSVFDNASDDLSTSQSSNVIQPKSKGADYLHLLSEAQAESQSKIQINSDCLSSLDDLLHDEFSRVVGSMISARGESILSWMEDDNFVLEEDGLASNHEPGFLSLDLNSLEKMLEKVDLHERLYIEPDLLSPELCTAHDKEPCHSHTAETAEAIRTNSNEPVSVKIDSVVTQGESSLLEPDQVTELSEKSSAIEADLDFLLNSYAESHTQPKPLASSSSKQPSAFETELDSLLNSHNDTTGSFNKPVNLSDQMLHTTGFDDVLDDLLESTSMSTKPLQNQTSSSSSSSVRKSKVLDEFDSWLDTI